MSDQNDKEKKQNIKITVDNEQTKILAEELARERIKNDKLVDYVANKEVKEDHSDLATLKLQAYEKFKNPMFLDAPNKETLSAMLTNYINELAERGKATQTPSGSPLVPQQYGQQTEDLYTRKFYDSQEMVSELRRLSHEGTQKEKEQAEHYLNELWKKYIFTKRANPTLSEPSQNPNTPESLLELGLEQKDGFLSPKNKEDGDLGQLQKKWREARKRKMENQL